MLDEAYSSNSKKQLYAIYDGNVIKFQPDGSTGNWHAYRVTNTATEVPIDVYKQMLKDGVINSAEYNRLVKNKWH